MAEYHFYFDTSIWVDIFDRRGYNGDIASQLLKKIILYDDHVLYSEIVIKELEKLGFSAYEIHALFGLAKPHSVIHVYSTNQQIAEAKKFSRQRNVPLCDALHAILARDHYAQLVSRDKDFEKLKDITRATIPEKLLALYL